ncbi:MAG TPA: aminotransferase class I/II-fold pyridoxal phosphate-dependent enzyme, partial [Rhodocyclaceae bacterium]|nr:aminotransferase class I/II-fold pyridoxal phosphate-dependent enzyme [Rhodocyclaceae bacterium]
MIASPQDLIRPELLELTAYHVPHANGMIKLDAMENPYHLPESLRDVVADVAHDVALNRYPDASATELKNVLRQSMNIPADCDIVLGNGSDELIQILAMGLAKPGAALLALEPSFVMYKMIARFCGLRYIGVPLGRNFSLDVNELLATIAREQPALIFIAYPNNPTGNLFSADDVESVLKSASGVVVIDEAYTPFAGQSFMPRATEFPNLIVMRTLSKLGLAALRLGYMVGAKSWMTEFEKLRLPYNTGSLTQAIAARVLTSAKELEDQAKAIVAERGRVAADLATMGGVMVFPSQANFLLL